MVAHYMQDAVTRLRFEYQHSAKKFYKLIELHTSVLNCRYYFSTAQWSKKKKILSYSLYCCR